MSIDTRHDGIVIACLFLAGVVAASAVLLAATFDAVCRVTP